MKYWAAMALVGTVLSVWAKASLPGDVVDFPVPVTNRTYRGPYRFLRHPMYVGNVLLITGLGGAGGGIWNALALFTLSELVMREWAWRERDPHR
jgi:protein-S-isoprenylcysteine O-methyltransferase Ste14